VIADGDVGVSLGADCLPERLSLLVEDEDGLPQRPYFLLQFIVPHLQQFDFAFASYLLLQHFI
jgi:hypothetical protein